MGFLVLLSVFVAASICAIGLFVLVFIEFVELVWVSSLVAFPACFLVFLSFVDFPVLLSGPPPLGIPSFLPYTYAAYNRLLPANRNTSDSILRQRLVACGLTRQAPDDRLPSPQDQDKLHPPRPLGRKRWSGP